MKKWLSFVLAMIMCIGVLLYVSADVNHGHGPGYVAEHEEGGGH